MCLLQSASLLELDFIYRLLCTLETAVERYSSFLSPPAGDAGGGILSCDCSVVLVVSSLKPSAAHEALGSDSTDCRPTGWMLFLKNRFPPALSVHHCTFCVLIIRALFCCLGIYGCAHNPVFFMPFPSWVRELQRKTKVCNEGKIPSLAPISSTDRMVILHVLLSLLSVFPGSVYWQRYKIRHLDMAWKILWLFLEVEGVCVLGEMANSCHFSPGQ